MKGCTHWGRHILAVLLAGAMLVSEIPAAVAADMPTTRLHLTPPESGRFRPPHLFRISSICLSSATGRQEIPAQTSRVRTRYGTGRKPAARPTMLKTGI